MRSPHHGRSHEDLPRFWSWRFANLDNNNSSDDVDDDDDELVAQSVCWIWFMNFGEDFPEGVVAQRVRWFWFRGFP